ncbi:MAG: Nramp family divalent metal transporter [Desulfomonile tiedjei]|nr:Nramp family divalent metal transporter [Desulfomonile tiedjei]
MGNQKNEASGGSIQIGVSRPPLPLTDIPTPEEVFNKPVIGGKELITCVLGPSMIALGVSIGSGEWLLGPLGFGKFGFIGLGFLVMISAVLQTFYNVENGRFTLATGEVPVVAFARTPPGYKFWIPVTVVLIYLGWFWGGWASAAGQSLYALYLGGPVNMKDPGSLQTVRIVAILLMILSLVIYMFGKKIVRTMEAIDTFLVFFILAVLITLTIVFAPAKMWGEMLASIVTPAGPPKGIDATTLGAIIGYTGFGTGFNFMLINYYRDHGYAMGHRCGFYSGIIGGTTQEVLPSGCTFTDTEQNRKTWKRWFRFLLLDQWGVFFVGAMIGMFIPSMLVVSLAVTPGAEVPSVANMPVYAAVELGKKAAWLFPFILFIGALILFKTQTTILEMLIRNTTDAAIAVSPRLQAWIGGDPRKFYYLLAICLIILIGIIIHLALPTKLLQYAANMANLASLIYPIILIYLNSKLPKPARSKWWSHALMIANVVFFGFFFFNFLSLEFTGAPLVKF